MCAPALTDLSARPPAARPGEKRRDHGGDTLRKALAQCNELLMNLDHVITDDDVRADIDKINKVRHPEHVLAPRAWRECLAATCLPMRAVCAAGRIWRS